MDSHYARHSHSHAAETDEVVTCSVGEEYTGKTGLRILSVFIILISSGLGSFFPVLASKYSFIRLPNWCFFIAKYFGSGVIVSTAFIHLLAHAAHALTESCLGGTFDQYPWTFGIALMSVFALFLVEIMSHHYMRKLSSSPTPVDNEAVTMVDKQTEADNADARQPALVSSDSGSDSEANSVRLGTEDFKNQLISVFILEAGIIFHSVFVGLSLAIAGEEFVTLFIVLVFHQMFEGLGLGTRIAEVAWPANRTLTPWILAFLYAMTTPIAIAIGLGVRHSLNLGSRKALIANGVFDSISAGILIYAGLVELMAFDFIYSNNFTKEKSPTKILLAFTTMAAGAGLMALLGKWA